MKPLRSVATIGILLLLAASTAQAFCGFFVARAETRLVNHASRVVIVRLGNHTEVTMANDYDGAPSEFAMVIPVPTVIQKDQVTPVDSSVIGHLDEYTAPRMAEYTDPSPCMEIIADGMLHVRGGHSEINVLSSQSVGRSDVKIEARYTVGQYDILVL